MSAAFAAGAVLPWLAIVAIPGPSRAPVTFVIVLAALALTGWVSARISQVPPVVPMVRTAGIGGLAMLITYFAGQLLYLTAPRRAGPHRTTAGSAVLGPDILPRLDRDRQPVLGRRWRAGARSV